MRADEKNKDDLEYMSQLGYEKIPVGESEIKELKHSIRKKSGIPGRLLFGIVLLGGLSAAVLFFIPGRATREIRSAEKRKTDPDKHASTVEEKIIQLDTVVVIKENFINPLAAIPKKEAVQKTEQVRVADSAELIVSKPIDLSLLANGIKEERLKFMINSPVFYLHDMKITNYTTLYFKKNHFVPFIGLSAEHSNRSEMYQEKTHLKQEAKYYLHEEIALAMLYFKRKQYDRVINSLKEISTYNEEDLNCEFYTAMSWYYKRNYIKATELFERCINNANNAFLQEAMFYKAVSLYELNEKEEAKRQFLKIAGEGEFYSEKAKAYLKE